MQQNTHDDSAPEMPKFGAVIEYDGTQYHGWQLQNDVLTIQGALEAVLRRLSGSPVRVHAAGRTDAGVHAIGQTVHFSLHWKRLPQDLLKACNALLPPDIAVRDILPVPESFHARHSAISKTYMYSILNRAGRPALFRSYFRHIPHPLNHSLMNEAAKVLLGSHDFQSFGQPTDGTSSTVRFISTSEVARKGDTITFTISGSGFLRYMVRSIIGTLVDVGSGKITSERFHEILNSRDRSQAGTTAPPHGLVLWRVDYRDVHFKSLPTDCNFLYNL